ncbi:MAG: PIN domain-containing protein [Acidobacteria bacterium]|nr:PIN domain-containing protein [Acidobacteriota bacterium]
MSFALDVNILVYASDTGSPFHEPATSFLDTCVQGNELFYLGWPTVMGYLRIATHGAVFDRPLTPAQAMANIEALLSLPHTRVLAEDEGFWDVYRSTTATVPTRGNLVPDAHLAALLRQHGVKTLYTHDRDFRIFDFLDVRDPFA